MNVYKIELLVIDFDAIGPEECKDVIENVCYPNRCISPEVKHIETRTVEWSDDHPLNKHATADAEYARLFSLPAPTTAQLLAEYMAVFNKFGIASDEEIEFIERHSDNKEFVSLAATARCLKLAIVTTTNRKST